MRCPLPAALLLLLYFSLPPYISFPWFLPPLPIAPLLLPPPSTSPPLLPPPPAASPPSLPSHLPAPAAAYTARYASSLSLCSPLVPLPLPWLSPPRQGAIYPGSFGDDRARRCALASHLVRCVSCRRARRRQTHVSAHSPTRRFARVRCSKCHRESFGVVAFSSDFATFLSFLSFVDEHEETHDTRGFASCRVSNENVRSRFRRATPCESRRRRRMSRVRRRNGKGNEKRTAGERRMAERGERGNNTFAAILTASYANPGHPVCSTRVGEPP